MHSKNRIVSCIYFRLIFLLFLTCSFASLKAVELYKYTDEYGRIYYTDTPPADETVEKLEIKIKSYDGEAQVFVAAGILNPAQSVVMYSAEWCGVCKRAKKYMQKNDIAFKEMDIDKSSRAKREYNKLNAKGVPVILVGKQRMNGFSPGKLEAMLSKTGSE